MPLWDNFADQIQTLPTAAAIDPANDRLVYAGATRSGAQAAVLRDVPHSLIWMLQASGVNVAPTVNTTLGSGRRDGLQTPYALTVMRLHLTAGIGYGAFKPYFDLYNETAGVSLLDNTSGLGLVLSFATGTDTIFTDDPVDVGAVSADQAIGFYCTQSTSTNIGSTWGHLQYIV